MTSGYAMFAIIIIVSCYYFADMMRKYRYGNRVSRLTYYAVSTVFYSAVLWTVIRVVWFAVHQISKGH